MSGITISRRNDHLIAVKASTPAGADRRFREAQLLARIDHPGIVQFVELIDGDTVELHMRYAGADTWERQPPTGAAAIVEGLAVVSATVADLHDLGTAHRALVAEHVVVAPDRRPVLCGLGDAGPADPTTIADDLAGLAGLIGRLSPGSPTDTRAALDGLARRVSAGELSARALTQELDALSGEGFGAHTRKLPHAPRPVLLITALVSLIGAAVLVLQPWSSSPHAAHSAPEQSITDSSEPLPRAPEPPPTAVIDTGTNQQQIVHNGRRFALGTTGDITVLGDWSCDGVDTPALLRPQTGLVALYLIWPEAGGAANPEHTEIFPAATNLGITTVDGCDQLRVIDPSGSALIVEVSS
jgi:serine/threonine protein kinase